MAARARRIDDAGQKIGGARKDMWRDRAMTVEDLDGMNAEERVALVSKDLVWPAPDYAALAGKGVDVKVLASIKTIRDAVPVRPNMAERDREAGGLRDPAAIHATYVRAVGICRDVVMAARTEADIASAYADFASIVGYSRSAAGEPVYAWRALAGRGGYPLDVDWSTRRRIEKLVRSGWPLSTVPAWRKGVDVLPRPAAGDFVVVDRKSRKVLHSAASEAAVDEWLKDRVAEAKEAKREEPKRPHLDALERVGGRDVREGRDIGPDDFLEAFGFRGVEFGLWLPDSERGRVLNMAYDALHDLADAMGVEPNAISMGGRLAIAFGARGSGRAAAHYEPGRKVLNVTRLSGAGSLAHEYGHALDHLAGDVDRAEEGRGHVRSGSGWRDWTRGRGDDLRNLEPDQAKAWSDVMRIVTERPRTKAEAIAAIEASMAASAEIREKERARLDDYLARTPEGQRQATFVRKMREWLADSEGRARSNAARRDLYVGAPEDGNFGTGSTDYAKEAQKLCGKSGDYWIRPNEMFARAFESAIFDRLAERGIRSDYLVHGVEGDRYEDAERYKGNPYPAGAERGPIRDAVLAVVDAMQPRLAALAAPAEAPLAPSH